MTTLEKLSQWANIRGIDEQPFDNASFTVNIIEELAELNEAVKDRSVPEVIDAIADIMVFCNSELTKLVTCTDSVLRETHKEINSRVGSWSEEHGKWMKDTSAEARAGWLKANYEPFIKKDIYAE
jgi:hypothetical protein